MIDDDEELPDKSKVQYEHLKRVKAQMAAEEEAVKATKIIKGADTKQYKEFTDNYVRPPKMELSDEAKLKLTRGYQALNILIGFIGLGLIFLITYYPDIRLSVLENLIIVFKLHNSTLHLSILENNVLVEINVILLGCVLIVESILWVIYFQHKHDKISDRINAGRSPKIGPRRIKHIRRRTLLAMGLAGVGSIMLGAYYSALYVSLLDNFAITSNIFQSVLYLSIFNNIVIRMNLILLGCALVATSLGIIGFRKIRG